MKGEKLPSPRALAFKEWMDGLRTNPSRVAKESHVAYTTLASFVQGDTRSLKGETEQKIADAYNTAVSVIFGGDERPARRVPVIDWVSAGQMVDPRVQPPAETQTIEIGGLPPGDYFATRVKGDSMDRISPDGSMILVNRSERDPVKGRRYVFARRGETTYKRFEVDPLRLEPESTVPANKPIFPKSDEEWEIIGRVRLTLMDDL